MPAWSGSELLYDVCLSFAGEQRAYVDRVASRLVRAGVKVFYDLYETANLWGEDLAVHLDEIYRKRARFCVMFSSADYARKVWTTHERRSAQARAMHSASSYILPVRFDETDAEALEVAVLLCPTVTVWPSKRVTLPAWPALA